MTALDDERAAHWVCVKMRDDALAEVKRLRAALTEAREWLVSVERELLSHGSTTLDGTMARIDAALGRNEQSAAGRDKEG